MKVRVRLATSSFQGKTFYALQNPQFRLLWFGNIFSFLGMQMQVIARGYLAFDLTGKNSALGGVMLAFGIPQLLLGLWGGVIADRLPKRRVLMVCQVIVASNSAWIAVMIAMGSIEYWMLLVAGAVQGAGFAFIGPARQAFISDLVDRDELGNAVVLQQLSMNSTRVIGPSLAGAFIAVAFIGTAGVYFITTAGFIVSTLMMLRLPPGNPRPRTDTRSPLADLTDGVRYVTARPQVGLLILASFAVVMIGFPYQSFLPSVAKDVYGVGSGGLGAIQSVAAVGAVIATVFVASLSQRKAVLWQPIAGIAFGIALAVFGLSSNLLVGFLAILFVGAMASAFQSLNNSIVMTLTDSEYHGRVQSMNMLSWSLFGLASLPIGIIADRVGIQETLVVMGILSAVAMLVIEAFRRAIVTREPVIPRTASGGPLADSALIARDAVRD